MYKYVVFALLLSADLILNKCNGHAAVTELDYLLKYYFPEPLKHYDLAGPLREKVSSFQSMPTLSPEARGLAASISILAPISSGQPGHHIHYPQYGQYVPSGLTGKHCDSTNVYHLRNLVNHVVHHNRYAFQEPLEYKPIYFMLKAYATRVVWDCMEAYHEDLMSYFHSNEQTSFDRISFLERLDSICVSPTGIAKNSLDHLKCSIDLLKWKKKQALKDKAKEILKAEGLSVGYEEFIIACRSLIGGRKGAEILDTTVALGLALDEIDVTFGLMTKVMFAWSARIMTCSALLMAESPTNCKSVPRVAEEVANQVFDTFDNEPSILGSMDRLEKRE